MDIIQKILNHKSFKNKPPILFHLGASGSLHPAFLKLKNYSVIVGVDGDERDFDKEKTSKNIKISQIISDKKGKQKFYLTKSPHCSSLLKPKFSELNQWTFKNKFLISKTIKVNTTTINQLLNNLKINYIDYYISDSQGVDLRVFKSVKKEIQKNITAVEFEPGLKDFYEKEDKIYDILKYMNKDYYIEDIRFGTTIKGNVKNFGFFSKLITKILYMINKKSKIYTNLVFFRSVKKYNSLNFRNLLFYLTLLIVNKRFLEVINIIDQVKSRDKILINVKQYCNFKIFIGFFLYTLKSPYLIIKKIKNYFYNE